MRRRERRSYELTIAALEQSITELETALAALTREIERTHAVLHPEEAPA